MRDSVRLGRIAGIRVGAHWSLVVMAVLVATGLANQRFAIEAPGHSRGAYVFAGVVTAAGLVLGVLAHELAHALVARREGMAVDGITLSWMGGVTRMSGESSRAAVEFSVAVVGPLTSAVLGGLFWAGRITAHHSGGDSLLVAALGWLAGINVVLAVFNLLPAAPLDGGRVLHALVWGLGRDRWRATRIAAGTGVALGGVLLVAGFIYTERNGDLINGLILTFIGWWLLSSARAELASGALHRRLEGVRVSEVMRPVGEAPGWLTVRNFVEQYGSSRPGWAWLLRDWNGGYAGVLVDASVTTVPPEAQNRVRVLDVALPASEAASAGPDEDAFAVMARTGGQKLVLVVAGGHTIGALLPSDIARRMGRGAPTAAR